MTEPQNGTPHRLAVILAAIVGILTFALLKLIGSFTFWPAVLIGLVVAIIVYFLFRLYVPLGQTQDAPSQFSGTTHDAGVHRGGIDATDGAAGSAAVASAAAVERASESYAAPAHESVDVQAKAAAEAEAQRVAQAEAEKAAAEEAAKQEAAEAAASAAAQAEADAEKAAEAQAALIAAAQEEAKQAAAAEAEKAKADAARQAEAEKAAQAQALDAAKRAEAEMAATSAVDAALDAPAPDQDFDGDGIVEGTQEGTKPEMLSQARDGAPDNLKEIKGVGPAMEKLLHSLGVYHFDQVASWNKDEVAWVDANLKGFKGRVSRDNWVDQAKTLAAGGETEFSTRVGKGGVY